MSTILVVEDDEVMRPELIEALEHKGHRVLSASDGETASKLFNDNLVQLVISDLNLPKMNGLALMKSCRAAGNDIPFIIMTAFGTVKNAVDAMREGAADYMMKPLSLSELQTKVGRLIESANLRTENQILRREISRRIGPYDMVGRSAGVEAIRGLIQKVAAARSPVLITGESGTGKELIARAIHSNGSAKGEPFVPVNCAAIPETMLESELFGHQKGAFTGATSDNEGLFRSARRGTIFLDEIGEMPQALQAKLLRVIEDKTVHPLGSNKFVPFEARILAATNRDLRSEVENKTFREDLFFRLSIVELNAPPLRQRREDIPLLAQHFLRRFNRDLNRSFKGFDEKAMQLLQGLPWKGNIRELQNAIERAVILGTEPLLTTSDFPTTPQTPSISIETNNLRDAMAAFEQAHLARVIAECDNDKRKAAAELGIAISSLYRLLGSSESTI